jgi:hypothetical protein
MGLTTTTSTTHTHTRFGATGVHITVLNHPQLLEFDRKKTFNVSFSRKVTRLCNTLLVQARAFVYIFMFVAHVSL